MSRRLSWFAGLGLIALLPAAGALADDGARLKALLQAKYPEGHVQSVAPADVAGWYEVITPDELVYTNGDGSLLFVGRLIDTTTKQDLTAKRWNALQSIDFASLPLDLAVRTVRGTGKRKLALFSDPHCPFCQQLEPELAKLDDVTIYTFLYPLESLHPGATAQAAQIWCAKDRAQAWSEWMLKHKGVASAACDTQALTTLQTLGTQLKVNATPTLFFGDGHRVGGYVDAAALEQELSRN